MDIKRSYTLGQLMNIDAMRQERASYCQVELVKTYHLLDLVALPDRLRSQFGRKTHLRGYFVVFKFKVVSNTGKAHIVYIRVNPDFDLNKWDQNQAQVYCDCEDFKYRSSWTLNDKNSLFLTDRIKNDLGASLTETPKKGSKTSLLCKHAFAAVQWLVNNYVSVMKTI